MKRLDNLDYLRGLSAFGIMIYHYYSYNLSIYGGLPADTLLGRIGIYGVPLFYVISGLSLHYVYNKKMEPTWSELLIFFKKRIFRIFPLLWFAIIIYIIISKQIPELKSLALNLTGLFGIINRKEYILQGSWSVGNELVFYLFFPIFIFLANRSKIILIIVSSILTGIYIHFAFNILDPTKTLFDQWKEYIHPLNQVLIFLGGFIIGMIFGNARLNQSLCIFILLLSISLFIFHPASGNAINLVTGFNRIIFTIICFAICISFYKLEYNLPAIIRKPLSMLGEASYSIYLLHPIVYSAISILISKHLFPFQESAKISVSVFTTLIASYFTYQYFEKYFIKTAKQKKVL